jgi:hypothetical protein
MRGVADWLPCMSGEILTGATSRELNHSTGLGCPAHRDYFAWRKWGISEQQEWFSEGYLYFRWNLKAYGALFCNWKWIKWFRRLFLLNTFFTGAIDHAPPMCFAGIYTPISWHPLWFSTQLPAGQVHQNMWLPITSHVLLINLPIQKSSCPAQQDNQENRTLHGPVF